MTLTIILLISAVVAAVDQLIKYFIVKDLAPVGSVSVIDNLFSLTYVENRGVAFGLFQNHIWIFALITAVLIAVFVVLIVKKKLTGKLFWTSAILLIGGGIGNLIDRIFRGFVVDYLSLSFFPPVCNFADYCITLGAVFFVIVLLTQSNENKNEAKTKEQHEENAKAAQSLISEKTEEAEKAEQRDFSEALPEHDGDTDAD